MQYQLYLQSHKTQRIDYTKRNAAAGVIGFLHNEDQPLAIADSKDSIVEIGFAHLGRNPSDTLYVTDSDGNLYETMINRPYHAACDPNRRNLAIAWSFFTLSMVCFLMTTIMGLGFWGIAFAVATILLYYAIVRGGVFNEIEACVVFVILLVTVMLLLPAVQAAMKTKQERANSALNRNARSSVFVLR